MPTLLNNYNMVLTISQDSINNQFFLLFDEGTIDNSINIAYLETMPKLVLDASVNSPTVDLVLTPASPYQLNFNLNFNEGAFTYMDYAIDPNNPQIADVAGWVITFLVNLQNMVINSTTPSGLKVSPGTQPNLSNYVGDDAFSVQALFLDFDNVNLSQAVITAAGVQMKPSDARYVWLMVAIQQFVSYIQKSGNPYILGFHAASNDPQQTNSQLPALAPTSVEFLSNQYNYPANWPAGNNSDDGLSALCYLAMTGNNPFPYAKDKIPAFVWNQIPSAQVQGRMFIDSNIFNSGYIQALVLPVLQNAMGGNGSWTQSGNSWTLDYQASNGDQNDGHGPVVGSDSDLLDIYGMESTESKCSISLDVGASVSNQLVYSGSGFFYLRLDLYERPFGIWAHDAWTSTKLPFTFSLTLSAGADGNINATFSSTPGTADPENWANPVVKFTDAIAGLFNASVETQLKRVNDSFSSFETSEFTNFTDAAQQGFQALSEQLILPAPGSFYYSNVGLNSENDVVLDVGYKS